MPHEVSYSYGCVRLHTDPLHGDLIAVDNDMTRVPVQYFNATNMDEVPFDFLATEEISISSHCS